MKILFVYSYICVDIVDGRYYHNFLKNYIERYKPLGELTICVSCQHCNSSMKSNVSFDGIKAKFITKENSIKKRFLDRSENKRTIRELVEENDWVITHVPDSVGELAAQYAHRLNKPFLAVAVGCPWDTLWNHSLRGKLIAPLSYLSMRRAMNNAPYALYVTSRFLQNRYPCKGISIGCSDVDLPAFDDTVLQKRLHKITNRRAPAEIKLATCAAVNVRFKGQQDVIKAIAILREQGIDVHYHLIGGGAPSYLRNLARETGVEQNVHFMGVQPHEKVFALLDEMDVYVQPSLTEGLPRALVEAMSRALPCIGTKVGGIPELLGDGCLYRPGNTKSLARLIAGLSEKKMQTEAIANFKHAKDYRSNLLNQRRKDFLQDIKTEIQEHLL